LAEKFGLKVFRCQTHGAHPPQGVNIVWNYIGHTKGILNWMLIRGMELINTLVRQLLSKDESQTPSLPVPLTTRQFLVGNMSRHWSLERSGLEHETNNVSRQGEG